MEDTTSSDVMHLFKSTQPGSGNGIPRIIKVFSTHAPNEGKPVLINRLYELLAGLLPVRKIHQLAKRRAPSVSAVERLEDRVVMTVDVWTGASSNLWSDHGNLAR